MKEDPRDPWQSELRIAELERSGASVLCLHLSDREIWNPVTPIKRRITAVACVSIFTPQPYPLARP